MLSPSPLSLFCALLLCVPLAIVFTTTTVSDTTRQEDPLNLLIVPATSTPPPPPSKPPTPTPPPPSTPEDYDYEDESLLRVASRVNSIPSEPKKIAYMFMTTAPLPLAPLWELYFNKTPKNLFNVYVHADPTHSYDSPFSGVFAHRVIPSKQTRRSTPTLISAARRLLAHALLDDPSNAMFVLLSASCIPLHSFNFTYTTLIRSNGSFIEILKDEEGAFDRWAARGWDAMLPEVKLEDFRIGSQFWILTRKHARLVVGDQRVWPKFNKPCVRLDTCYPEENYFSTLLSMLDPRGCIPATLTHVDWKGSFGGHPRTYKAFVVGPDLILSIRKTRPRYGDEESNGSDSSVRKRHDPFLFARKFSPNSIARLMSVANEVILKE